MLGDYRPRLSIELTEEQHKKISALIGWGQQRAVFSVLVDELINLIEEHGQLAIGALLSKKVSFLDTLRSKEAKGATPRPKVKHK